MKTIKNLFGLAWMLAGLGCLSASAAAPNMAVSEVKTVTVQVPLNKSRMLNLRSGSIGSIKMGNPNIAKLDTLPPNQLLIQGIALGTTNVIISSGGQKVDQVINVEVTHDLDTLKARLHELLPGEAIEVRSSQNNIVLSGMVSGPDKMQSALDIASSFLPNTRGNTSQTNNSATPAMGNAGDENTNNSASGSNSGPNAGAGNRGNQGPRVINMLSVSGAHQVMLEVKVAEIDRRVAKGLNIQFNALKPSSSISFGALNGGGTFSPVVNAGAGGIQPNWNVSSNLKGLAGPIRTLLQPNAHSIDAAGLFMSAVSGDFIFNLTVDAAKDQNLAKILAEPTLTTLSGQEATFLSGGEFPVPVPQTSSGIAGGITIEYKQFGVSLRCIPVVLDSGRINLNLNVSVSELSNDAAIATNIAGSDLKFTIPSLTKREASSTLELADSQTMSIAGLISENLRENVNKFPGLGDVPVLGALFRNEQFLKNQTELVIFVTPKLAKPVLAKNISLPTDNFVEPDDVDFYVFGKLEARDAEKQLRRKEGRAGQGGLDGQFGHQLSEDKL